jgi:RecA/RadA recombinase
MSKLTKQVEEYVMKDIEEKSEFMGNDKVISTGSTLLDLAISGGRFSEGGIPGGIMVEISGLPASGKTTLLCEIAGNVQRQGGKIMFRDPEARLNKQYAKMFGLDIEGMDYDIPSTVTEVFEPIRKWNPEPSDVIHGIFADSLAALSTQWEEDGKDQYGMRRAKEFSEQCRLTCRYLAQKGFLMVCSNQLRQNADAGMFGQKYKTPGGEAIGFYSSLRLRCINPSKIKVKKKVEGKEISRVVGVQTEIEVFKSSVDTPFRTAPLTIIFDYGIDTIRDNLQFIKDHTNTTVYTLEGQVLDRSMEKAIQIVEENGLEDKLKQEVINLWRSIEDNFKSGRSKKR